MLEGLGEHLNPEKVRMFYIEDNKDSIVDLMKSRGYTSFNSRFYYIDKLRRINQTASDFFVAGDTKVKVNALWVPKGSAEEAFLNTQQRFR